MDHFLHYDAINQSRAIDDVLNTTTTSEQFLSKSGRKTSTLGKNTTVHTTLRSTLSGENSSDVAAFRHFRTLFNMHASLHRQLQVNALPVNTSPAQAVPSNAEASDVGANPSYDEMLSLSASLYSEQQFQSPPPHHQPSGQGPELPPVFSPPYMSSSSSSGISTPTHSYSHKGDLPVHSTV